MLFRASQDLRKASKQTVTIPSDFMNALCVVVSMQHQGHLFCHHSACEMATEVACTLFLASFDLRYGNINCMMKVFVVDCVVDCVVDYVVKVSLDEC